MLQVKMKNCIRNIFFASAILLLFAHTFLPHQHLLETRDKNIYYKAESDDVLDASFWCLIKRTISENLGIKHLENYHNTEFQKKITQFAILDYFSTSYSNFTSQKIAHKTYYKTQFYNSEVKYLFRNRAPPILVKI